MAEFYVKVEPGSESFSVEQAYITKVSLTEPAENGRANAELIRELESILGEKPAIISGHRSRRKKLKVDISEEKVEEKLRSF
ncbi:DUF167 domain-containing protein [Candidatus Nanohalobium constans]|uniref:Uncharacterized protein n=1 Tax=Candidatus Nanohalobium constans TaxID=2565781 RepID=A0A5Q0UFZ1_9ARCH|nr:DUF167 domain-containing protein [Candidatus Nanohalobium constans]QGA79919.1 hypothetical protein LC1Nh_0010 [Candidatus Nanohalobium constans]